MNFALLNPEYVSKSYIYEQYPYIELLVRIYESRPYPLVKCPKNVNDFHLYNNQDRTRVLLSAYLPRRVFNTIKFIIDVKSNKLLCHGTATICVTFSRQVFYHSYKNMFMRIVTDFDMDDITYELIGTKYTKTYHVSQTYNENLNIKLLLKLCRLIKLCST